MEANLAPWRSLRSSLFHWDRYHWCLQDAPTRLFLVLNGRDILLRLIPLIGPFLPARSATLFGCSWAVLVLLPSKHFVCLLRSLCLGLFKTSLSVGAQPKHNGHCHYHEHNSNGNGEKYGKDVRWNLVYHSHGARERESCGEGEKRMERLMVHWQPHVVRLDYRCPGSRESRAKLQSY